MYTGNYRHKEKTKSTQKPTSSASSTQSARKKSTETPTSSAQSRKKSTQTPASPTQVAARKVPTSIPQKSASRRSTRRNSHTSNTVTRSCSESDFIAFRHPSWSDKPLIGHIVAVKKETVTIHWWIGRYVGSWKECTKDGEPWLEDIPNDSIIHRFSWNTTATNNRLTKDHVTAIKKSYS